MDSFEAVEKAAQHYYHSPQQLGIDNRVKALVMENLIPHLQGPKILELGFVDGMMTDRLLQLGYQVDCVDGASRHIEYGRKKYASEERVRLFHSLFQEFDPPSTYNTVVAGDMIRYIAEPVGFLRKVSGWLKPGGKLLLTVPNNRSLHLRAGALLAAQAGADKAAGPLSLGASNRRDREVGNLRSYDRYDLRELLVQAAYAVEALHGAFLKPLSSAQMNEWSDELLTAFSILGEELEDYCWFLYAVASPIET